MTTQIKLDTRKLDQIIDVIGSRPVKRRVIHDGVEYGVHQEFATNAGGRPRPRRRGGITGRGHPSLVPAFERHTKDLPKDLGLAIEAGIDLDIVMGNIALFIMQDWQADVNVDTGAYKNSITVSEE